MKKFFIVVCCPFVMFGQSFYTQVDDLFEDKKFMKAEQLLAAHINEHPDDEKAIELLGDAYGSQRKWDAAIHQYKVLVQLDGNAADYHYKYGGALGIKATKISKIKALGIVGEVKKSLLKAAELDMAHIETRWALVELFMQLPALVGGSKKKALKYAKELQHLSKLDGYLAKGFIYEYDKESVLAEKYYKMAILNEDSPKARNELTTRKLREHKERNTKYYQLGKIAAVYNLELDRGTQWLHTYIKNHSAKDGVSLAWAYVRLAQIYRHKKSKTQALKWINKAIAARVDFKEAIQEKAIVLSMKD